MKLANTATRTTQSPLPRLPTTDTKALAKSAPRQPAQAPSPARATPGLADGFDTQRPSARAAVLLGAPALPPAPAAKSQSGGTPGAADARQSAPSSVQGPQRTQRLQAAAASDEVPAPPGLALAAQTATEAASIDTVGDKRAAIEAGQKEFFTETQTEVERIFAMGSGAEATPPGSTVVLSPDGKTATLTQVDKAGQPVSVTAATRHEDGRVELDTVRLEGERFERDSILAGVDSSTVKHANWQATEGASVTTVPSFDELRQARDPDVRVSVNSVWQQDGNLYTQDSLQKDGGVQQSETEFTRTDNRSGIADDLQGTLQDGAPTDVVRTRAYSIPPPSADGQTQPPTYTDVQSWSQPGAQVTKTDSRPLDFESEFDVGNQPHNLADLEQVVNENRDEGGESFKGSKEYPRRWLIEKSSAPGHYQSQSFIEGHKEATILLERRAIAGVLTEEYSGKTFSTDPDVKGLVEVSGSATRYYAEDGSVMRMSSEAKNPDGSSTTQWYNRLTYAEDDGLHMLEDSSIETTDKNGQSFSTSTNTESVLSDQGLRLAWTETYTRTPDGTQAHARMDDQGERYSVKAPGSQEAREVTDPSELPQDPNAQEALLQASVTNAMTVRDYAANGGKKSLELVQKTGELLEELPLGKQLFGSPAVSRALQGGVGVTGALAGAAGVAGNGMLLMQAIRDENVPKIIQSAVLMGASGYDMYQGGSAFIKAMKGIDAAADLSSGALQMPGWFAKVPGLAGLSKSAGALKVLGKMGSGLKALGGIGTIVGVGLGAYDVYEGIKKGNGWQVAKGTVGIAGTIAGAVATGAVAGSIGGPLGAAAGAVVGIAIGLATWGVGKLIDWFDDLFNDPEHDLAPVQI